MGWAYDGVTGRMVYAVRRCCGLVAVVFIVEVSVLVMGFTRVRIAMFQETCVWGRWLELPMSVSIGRFRVGCSIFC